MVSNIDPLRGYTDWRQVDAHTKQRVAVTKDGRRFEITVKDKNGTGAEIFYDLFASVQGSALVELAKNFIKDDRSSFGWKVSKDKNEVALVREGKPMVVRLIKQDDQKLTASLKALLQGSSDELDISVKELPDEEWIRKVNDPLSLTKQIKLRSGEKDVVLDLFVHNETDGPIEIGSEDLAGLEQYLKDHVVDLKLDNKKDIFQLGIKKFLGKFTVVVFRDGDCITAKFISEHREATKLYAVGDSGSISMPPRASEPHVKLGAAAAAAVVESDVKKREGEKKVRAAVSRAAAPVPPPLPPRGEKAKAKAKPPLPPIPAPTPRGRANAVESPTASPSGTPSPTSSSSSKSSSGEADEKEGVVDVAGWKIKKSDLAYAQKVFKLDDVSGKKREFNVNVTQVNGQFDVESDGGRGVIMRFQKDLVKWAKNNPFDPTKNNYVERFPVVPDGFTSVALNQVGNDLNFFFYTKG